MVSFISTRLKRKTPEPEIPQPDPIALALIRDENEQHRHRTLAMIYYSTDSECISMIRIKRAAFFGLVSTFRERGLVTDREGVLVEEQVTMFLHVVGHNQRFRVSTSPLGGPSKLSTSTFIKCCMLWVSLEMK
jgi:hypothetical protein